MAKKLHARRYAQAIFEIAVEREELELWQTDLKEIVRLGEDAGLISFLESPKISFDDKSRLLAVRLAGLSPLALNLVYVLVIRGGLGVVSDIAKEYERWLNNYRGIEPAEVITAVPLDDEHKQKLTERLSMVFGQKVVIKTEVDTSLIGGLVARVGGKLMDGSVRNKLEALKRELVGAGS